jgi:hypothetical protein
MWRAKDIDRRPADVVPDIVSTVLTKEADIDRRAGDVGIVPRNAKEAFPFGNATLVKDPPISGRAKP